MKYFVVTITCIKVVQQLQFLMMGQWAPKYVGVFFLNIKTLLMCIVLD